MKKKTEKSKIIAPKAHKLVTSRSHNDAPADAGHFVSKSLLPSKAQEPVLIMDAEAAKTPLGRRLLEIRARAIASGMKLLSEEELDKELAERRGGLNESP